jgi:hypothetical protein
MGLVAFTLSACDISSPECPLPAPPAVRLSVIDSVTSGRVKAPEVFAKVTDNAYADSIRVPSKSDGTLVFLALDRTGIYNVEVRADGYRTWTLSDVQVTRGVCLINTAALIVRMRPS